MARTVALEFALAELRATFSPWVNPLA